jgi:hypothetical protein
LCSRFDPAGFRLRGISDDFENLLPAIRASIRAGDIGSAATRYSSRNCRCRKSHYASTWQA